MAGRKLVRDLLIARQPLYHHLASQQESNVRVRLLSGNGFSSNRRFSVFNEFLKEIKGEADRNPEFKQSVEELKGKAEEQKVRMKQTTQKLYKQVDGAQTEPEATAEKVSANMKEKISATKEEETFGIGKKESSQSTSTSAQHGTNAKDGDKVSSGEQKHEQSGSGNPAETLGFSSLKVSLAFHRLKKAKVADLAKKGYDIVKDKLSGNQIKRKHLEYTSPPAPTGERSKRTDIVVLSSKQSH